MLITKFFENTLGKWESHRTYMYPKLNKIKTLITYFEWECIEDNKYKVIWNSSEGEGAMTIMLSDDNYFSRDVGYFTKDTTISNIEEVNPNYLFTKTSYNNMTFNEKITFLDKEHRVRQTIGYKDIDNSITLSGSYQEFKIK